MIVVEGCAAFWGVPPFVERFNGNYFYCLSFSHKNNQTSTLNDGVASTTVVDWQA